jgi:hypothetical protein
MLALAPNMKGRSLLRSEKTIASFIQRSKSTGVPKVDRWERRAHFSVACAFAAYRQVSSNEVFCEPIQFAEFHK